VSKVLFFSFQFIYIFIFWLLKEVPHYFVPKDCGNLTAIGPNCSIPATPCDMLDPCRNNGSCFNNGTNVHGYFCSCPNGFNGSECQFDHQPCKPNTCWNNGIHSFFSVPSK
jgi:hypothetical protein